MKEINQKYLETLLFYCQLLKKEGFSTEDEDFSSYRKVRDLDKIPLFLKRELLRETEKILNRIKKEAEKKNINIPLEEIKSKYQLTKEEWLILGYLYYKRLVMGEGASGYELLSLICEKKNFLDKMEILSPNSKLLKKGLIKERERFSPKAYSSLPFERSYGISDKVFYEISGINIKSWRNIEDTEKFYLSDILIIREPEISFDQLILPKEMKEKIFISLWQYENGKRVMKEYGLINKIPYNQPVIMLFYGPSGTGKTATSEAIAKYLNKKLGICNYAQLYDCYVGESEKNLLKVFKEAKEQDCVLLFDEADALFGERLRESRSVDRMHNTMTNILMQILERTEQLIILTTNREFVMDRAFERRILLKLEFEIPQEDLRKEIWQFFLKDCLKLSSDISFEELAKYSLSGGKIKNVVIKTIMRCAKENREITLQDLKKAAQEELKETFTKEEKIGFLS